MHGCLKPETSGRAGIYIPSSDQQAFVIKGRGARRKAMKPIPPEINMSPANEVTENKLGCDQDFGWREIVRLALAVLIHQY